MLKDFRKFILRGNAVDLAAAVVFGAAFGAIVTSLVKDILTPLIAAVFGQPDFSALSITINGSKILYGNFLNAAVAFLLIATALFFFVIQPINKLTELSNRNKTPEDSSEKKCPHCLSTIPKGAKVCAFCTKTVK